MQLHIPPFTLKEIKIEVSYRCNLNCVHCSSDAQPSNLLEMSREECIRILEQATGIGAKVVAFSGGEPLLWPYISDAVAKASELGLRITIYTSGNVDDFKTKAKQIHKLGAYRFVFSIFGGNSSTHERVTRIAGSYNNTLKAVAASLADEIETEFHFVPMTNNYRELSDVVEMGRIAGVSVVSVLRLVPQGRAFLLQQRALSRIQYLELRNLIINLRNKGYTIRTGSPYNLLMLSDTPMCCAGIDRLIIGPDLRIYPCDAFKQIKAEELVGTLEFSTLKEFSVSECWERSPFLSAVRKYLTSPFEDPCDSCTNLEKCLSGCLAQKVIANGTLDKTCDPDCLMH